MWLERTNFAEQQKKDDSLTGPNWVKTISEPKRDWWESEQFKLWNEWVSAEVSDKGGDLPPFRSV